MIFAIRDLRVRSIQLQREVGGIPYQWGCLISGRLPEMRPADLEKPGRKKRDTGISTSS